MVSHPVITVKVPTNTRRKEYEYVLTEILSPRLNVSFRLDETPSINENAVFILPNEATLYLELGLLGVPNDKWLSIESLPPHQARMADDFPSTPSLPDPSALPLLGLNQDYSGSWFSRQGQVGRSAFDPVSAIFFLLTRYEEWVDGSEDQHGRFPAGRAWTVKAGVHLRPVADHYVEILRGMMRQLWQNIPHGTPGLTIVPTHDIDHLARWKKVSVAALSKHILGLSLKYKDPSTALKDMRTWLSVKMGRPENDIYYQDVRTLMDWSEKRNLSSAFYFIPMRRGGSYDTTYDLRDGYVRRLMEEITQRGHQIGIHPSYQSLGSINRLVEEKEQLMKALTAVGVSTDRIGGRQHYLRWQAKTTWRDWSVAGLDYDSSVYFPEAPGFRCGTCHPFRPFDLKERQTLSVTERPLILMDGSFKSLYFGQEPSLKECAPIVETLSERCRQAGGEFVVLWHNSMLGAPLWRELYKLAISK